MKRCISVLLCFLFLFSVTGCSNSETPSSSSSQNPVSSQGSISTESTSSEVDANTSVSPVDDAFFNDAVFIGDSVTLKLSYYADKVRNSIGLPCLGEAKFLCSGSLGYANAMWDIDDPNNVHPMYQGTTYLVQDGVAATGAKKVFIMLGMNDFSLYGTETTIENARTLIGKILDKSPDAQIYVQSVTPIVAGNESGSFSNENIRLLNDELVKMCENEGYRYLNVAEILTDENGCLISDYCSDPDSQGIHFTDEACEKWIEYLEENAG